MSQGRRPLGSPGSEICRRRDLRRACASCSARFPSVPTSWPVRDLTNLAPREAEILAGCGERWSASATTTLNVSPRDQADPHDAGISFLRGGPWRSRASARRQGLCRRFRRPDAHPLRRTRDQAVRRRRVEEAMRLETALRTLRTERRVVVLHYAPVAATVEGEPKEISFLRLLPAGRDDRPLRRERGPARPCPPGHLRRRHREGHPVQLFPLGEKPSGRPYALIEI